MVLLRAAGSIAAISIEDEMMSRVDALALQLAELGLMIHKGQGNRAKEIIGGS